MFLHRIQPLLIPLTLLLLLMANPSSAIKHHAWKKPERRLDKLRCIDPNDPKHGALPSAMNCENEAGDEECDLAFPFVETILQPGNVVNAVPLWDQGSFAKGIKYGAPGYASPKPPDYKKFNVHHRNLLCDSECEWVDGLG